MNQKETNGKRDELIGAYERLSSELYALNKRLKESEAFKSHFISNISNELINPFSSILALSEQIQSLDDAALGEAREMARLIYREAFSLDFQLRNIFAAARFEAGIEDLLPVSVNLPELLKQSVAFFCEELDSSQLTADIRVGTDGVERLRRFVTDETACLLIMRNLLSNAIKFSMPGGIILLRLEIQDSFVLFSIRDFGKGIPEENEVSVFDRFRQLDWSINSRNTGQGLGLSVVQACVQQLNGTVRLIRPDGGGLEVSVRIPELGLSGEGELDGFLLNPDERF
ncbi:MAG: sensor histidine kinase [Mangrovibacterium sp.]